MNDFLKQYELYLKAVAKANKLNKAIVFDALAAAGLTRVTVEFDGEGDSGQITGITAHAGEAPAEFPSTSLILHRRRKWRGLQPDALTDTSLFRMWNRKPVRAGSVILKGIWVL